MNAEVLVAGIGNIFLGDDGFGVAVAGELAARDLPGRVRVADFGIRGVHLAYELLDGYASVILVDAVAMGEAPGTLAVIEAEPDAAVLGEGASPVGLDAHGMTPQVVLDTLARLGGSVGRILVVGCQPAVVDEGMGLSPAVAAAVTRAADLCAELVEDLIGPAEKGTCR